MRNQYIEQCAIYTLFTCGSYLEWAFGPKYLFLLPLDPMLMSKLPRGPLEVIGKR